MVTLSWSLKNFVTTNIMVMSMGAVLLLGTHLVRAATKPKGANNG